MTVGSYLCSQVGTKKEATSAFTNMQYGKAKKPPSDLAAVAGSSEVLLANVVRGIEGKMEDRPADEERATGESTRPGRV